MANGSHHIPHIKDLDASERMGRQGEQLCNCIVTQHVLTECSCS
jgi:hypothetical protein